MNLTSYRFLLGCLKPLVAYSGFKRCKRYQDADYPILHCFLSRFGRNPAQFDKGGIWIHAVSVGETRSIFPLLTQLKARYPTLPLTLTNGSTQGALQSLKFSPVKTQHQLIPYDYPSAVNRFLDQLSPKLVIMVETEIWPNLYQACHERDIPIILINARLKEASFNAYQKWGGKLIANALKQTRFIASQYPIDNENFIKLGASPKTTQFIGNLKVDIEKQPGLVLQAQKWALDNRFVWVAASTHKGEEEEILLAHGRLLKHQPNALLILVPRHETRFKQVIDLCQQSYSTQTRSSNQSIAPQTHVFVADSVGEMMLWFQIGNVAFVGGSLVPFGGHNILEPASLKKPIISGSHFQNLSAMFSAFITEQAITTVDNEASLAETLIKYESCEQRQKKDGEKSYACFKKQAGALDRLLKMIQGILPTQ